MACRHFLLHLVLLSLTLLSTVPSLSVSAQRQPDHTFRGWTIGNIVPHPTSDIAYVLDYPRYIHTVNTTTGAVLPQTVSIDTAQRILAIAVDGSSGRVHALIQASSNSWIDVIDRWLVTLTADLQIVGNLSLATLDPPLSRNDRTLTRYTLPVDKAGNLYYARQLNNGTVLVHAIAADTQLIRTWSAPFPTERWMSYYVALGPDDVLYFQTDIDSIFHNGEPRPLHLTTTDGVLLPPLDLHLDPWWCEYVGAIAVSPRSGNIAVSCDETVVLYNSSASRLQSFSYSTPLDYFNNFESLAFDNIDRLLAVARYGGFGVQVISTTNGDLLSDWSNRVPSLSYTLSLKYQPSTQSLLTFQNDRDMPIMRLDADNGALLQEYTLIGRLSRCFTIGSVVGESGDLYLLILCFEYDGSGQYTSKTLLHTLTAAGRTRREVALAGLEGNVPDQNELVVCEDKQMLYIVVTLGRAARSHLVAFSFNGTAVFTATDSRIGDIGGRNTHLRRANDNTLAIVQIDRIVLIDLDNGAFFGNISIAPFTLLLAAEFDGQSWFRSEVSWSLDYEWSNSTINQYSVGGALLAQYAMSGREFDALTIGGSGSSQRLYGLDRSTGTVAWWNIKSAHVEQQQTAVSVKRHSSRDGGMLQAAGGQYSESDVERFKAAVEVRRQQWLEERTKRQQEIAAVKGSQMRANRTERVL